MKVPCPARDWRKRARPHLFLEHKGVKIWHQLRWCGRIRLGCWFALTPEAVWCDAEFDDNPAIALQTLDVRWFDDVLDYSNIPTCSEARVAIVRAIDAGVDLFAFAAERWNAERKAQARQRAADVASAEFDLDDEVPF